jgi:cell division protein FtsZ
VLINITGASDMTLFEVNEAATLVQEAAHEDANIIFGAVVDDTLSAGELRVTVIATGLDDGRMRRDVDRDRSFEPAPYEDLANVTPLHREGADSGPAAEFEAPAPHARAGGGESEIRARSEEDLGAGNPAFVSPFEEDALEVPAFMRKSAESAKPRRDLARFFRRSAEPKPEDEEDRDTPAFQRRLAD